MITPQDIIIYLGEGKPVSVPAKDLYEFYRVVEVTPAQLAEGLSLGMTVEQMTVRPIHHIKVEIDNWASENNLKVSYDYMKDAYLFVAKSLSPTLGKGAYKGPCNRSSCLKMPALYYNHSTGMHYCEKCAELINEVNTIKLCTLVKEDAKGIPEVPYKDIPDTFTGSSFGEEFKKFSNR